MPYADAAHLHVPRRTKFEKSDEPRLLILSNCNILRSGLAKALARWPFQQVDSLRVEDIETLTDSNCDIVLFDIPWDAAVDEEFSKLAACLHGIPYVVLAESFSFDVYAASLRYRAAGYLLKDTPLSALQVALLLVLDGKDVFPSQLVLAQFSTMILRSPVASPKRQDTGAAFRKLSQQEMKILALLAQGDSNKLIARRLGSCEATIKVQMKAIFRKLGLQNRTQAAVWAVKNGFESTLLNSETAPRP
jgi:two-component system nitrate/nitrite response regulator NarL